MGNTTSCCVSSSPKLRRNAHSRLESYRPEADLSREDTGCNLQHISDRENIDGEGRRQLPPSPPLCLSLPAVGAPSFPGALRAAARPLRITAGRSSPCLPRCRETAVFVLVIHAPYSLCSLSLQAVEARLTPTSRSRLGAQSSAPGRQLTSPAGRSPA